MRWEMRRLGSCKAWCLGAGVGEWLSHSLKNLVCGPFILNVSCNVICPLIAILSSQALSLAY